MLGISVETARNVGIGAIVALLVLMLLAAWVVKKVVGKVILVVVLAGLAFGVWTQRNDLERCADSVRTTGLKASCRLFGQDITLGPPVI